MSKMSIQKAKRFVATLLTFAMMLSLLPMTVLAEEQNIAFDVTAAVYGQDVYLYEITQGVIGLEHTANGGSSADLDWQVNPAWTAVVDGVPTDLNAVPVMSGVTIYFMHEEHGWLDVQVQYIQADGMFNAVFEPQMATQTDIGPTDANFLTFTAPAPTSVQRVEVDRMDANTLRVKHALGGVAPTTATSTDDLRWQIAGYDAGATPWTLYEREGHTVGSLPSTPALTFPFAHHVSDGSTGAYGLFVLVEDVAPAYRSVNLTYAALSHVIATANNGVFGKVHLETATGNEVDVAGMWVEHPEHAFVAVPASGHRFVNWTVMRNNVAVAATIAGEVIIDNDDAKITVLHGRSDSYTITANFEVIGGDTPATPAELKVLTDAIIEANRLIGLTDVADNAISVDQGRFWVRPAVAPATLNAKEIFEAAVKTADDVAKTADVTAAKVAEAVNTLATAQRAFTDVNVRQAGTRPVGAGDPAELKAAVVEAQRILDETIEAANGVGIYSNKWWAPAQVRNTFNTAIATAKAAADATPVVLTQVQFDAELARLISAQSDFTIARQRGAEDVTVVQLNEAVAEALEFAKTATVSTVNGADVLATALWVTQDQMNAFTAAITAADAFAKAATSTTTTEQFSAELAKLEAATTNFRTARQPGTMGDVRALNAAITLAETNKATAVVAANGSALLPSELWVTSNVMVAFEAAITAAKAVAATTPVPAQMVLNNAVSELEAAQHRFMGDRNPGTRTTATPAELNAVIAAANNLLNSTFESVNDDGADIPANSFWATRADREHFRTAIAAASSLATAIPAPAGTRIAEEIGRLATAQRAFESVRAAGTRPLDTDITITIPPPGTITGVELEVITVPGLPAGTKAVEVKKDDSSTAPPSISDFIAAVTANHPGQMQVRRTNYMFPEGDPRRHEMVNVGSFNNQPLGTGMEIHLLDENGNIIDTIVVVVENDFVGDGGADPNSGLRSLITLAQRNVSPVSTFSPAQYAAVAGTAPAQGDNVEWLRTGIRLAQWLVR